MVSVTGLLSTEDSSSWTFIPLQSPCIRWSKRRTLGGRFRLRRVCPESSASETSGLSSRSPILSGLAGSLVSGLAGSLLSESTDSTLVGTAPFSRDCFVRDLSTCDFVWKTNEWTEKYSASANS